MAKVKECDVVRDCQDVLLNAGLVHWRSQSGSFRAVSGAWFRTGAVGLPDICAIIPPRGRLLLVECKQATGRLSHAQCTFMDRAGRNGAFCVVIRDSSELKWVIERLMENPDLKPEEL